MCIRDRGRTSQAFSSGTKYHGKKRRTRGASLRPVLGRLVPGFFCCPFRRRSRLCRVFGCLIHRNGELLAPRSVPRPRPRRSASRCSIDSAPRGRADAAALALKDGGKSLFCSRCLRARDRISSESRSAGRSSLPIQAVRLCTKRPAYAAGRRGRHLRRARCFSW